MKRMLILCVLMLVVLGTVLSGCTGNGGTNDTGQGKRISKLVVGKIDPMNGII